MPPFRNLRLLVLGALLLGAAALTLGWREGRRYERGGAEGAVAFASLRTQDAQALTEEAIHLYAAGQFPRACEKFGLAAADDPSSATRRLDVIRCFEGWGWHALREGRPDEATLLFEQGLTETPDDPALLKGLGVAAVHAGRPDDAFAPLERAAQAQYDPEVRLLLAHLHDRRDDPARAVVNLKAVLQREPTNEPARWMLDKVEREWRAEAGFRREVTSRFVVKYRDTLDGEARREIVAHLEAAAARVGRALGYAPHERTTVVLYEHREFRDVTRVHAWATGLFDGKIRLPVGRVRPPVQELERLARHEYAHAAIHDLTRGRAPRWLHEGLAQALEGAPADQILRAPAGLTLAGVEALAADSDPVRARAGYDIALWIVRDLLDRGGMVPVRELLARLGAGETMAEAMPRVYGLRLTELESQWRRVLGG
ncbi:MAG TPA: tetratricopeptide repeat protein [Methylomirabilota bacterium]|nr:tetratricopeptide repeat protein [Methylomirabilota bacterium]